MSLSTILSHKSTILPMYARDTASLFSLAFTLLMTLSKSEILHQPILIVSFIGCFFINFCNYSNSFSNNSSFCLSATHTPSPELTKILPVKSVAEESILVTLKSNKFHAQFLVDQYTCKILQSFDQIVLHPMH